MFNQDLSLDAYRLMLIVARIGPVVMMFPGLSAPYVSHRIRLSFAMSFSFLMLPVLAPYLPPMPTGAARLVVLVVGEVTVGIFMGVVMQSLMAALHLAGTTIAASSGITNTMVFDPITEQQGAMMVGFFSNIAILAMFATDMHHLIFRAAVDTYGLFQPGQPLLTGDMANLSVAMVNRSLLIGVQLSGPFIVGSLVFQASLGLMARMMPQMNAFFTALPAQLLLGLALLMIATPPMIMVFLQYFRDGLQGFTAPG